MIVHEWNIWAFFEFFFFFLSSFNECEMQMSYANAMIGLTNALCNHCALTAINRLLTTDLTINFLWMQTKHDANLDFLFPMLMLLDEDANAIFFFIYDANVHLGMQWMRMPP